MQDKHCVGVVGNWSNMNYGAQLTYYALYQTLMDENFGVTMIEGDVNNDRKKSVLAPGLFRKNPYPSSSLLKRNITQMQELNEQFDSFVVGSDQLWRYCFFKPYRDVNILSFVSSDRRKISYATSFGEEGVCAPIEYISKMRYFLSRFQKISVREQSGVDICQNIFDVQAECVLDPVFLCDIQHYEVCISNATVGLEEPFIFVYIVHPSAEKKEMIERIVSELGKKAIFVRSLYKSTKYENWNVPFEADCKIEEWLYYIKNCERILTDSFHACCFSVIFHKQIIPLFQTIDGSDSAERVFSLADILGIEGLKTMENLKLEDYYIDSHQIDYAEVNQRLEKEKLRCKKWLLDALQTEVSYDRTDLLWDIIRPEIYKYHHLEQTVMEQKREINRMKYRDRNIILFGAGEILERVYSEVIGLAKICAIMDNDPKKWGKFYGNIKCISPQQIVEYDDPYVIITIKNEAVVEEIRNQLEDMGIKDIALLAEWLEV